ncbi:MAG: FHA domain-containing protein [Micropruina sp.]
MAEVWIDPDWYATQGSPEPLPSPGLPDVVPLFGQSALIGRLSLSRKIEPEIDCELDNGCSRKHAQLTTDGTRWWIEDLESANGTFVGSAAGPLPAMPIPRGRVEISSGQRIYVGAWTRIVVRRATPDERQAFALNG